ncbi:hypothetical protein BDN70DRAFT_930231 [Pholiota conissans]|uniref:Uncharacterized protein n=1 Tax=Pholiota conissans TaxID=109636 RepID=A0A9P6D3M8_9AGAR|nr:hypothetical protein BDN70DRAFT_930231 [Pholiota conissans]
MVFSILSLSVSLVIWSIPAVIIITFSYHTYILLIGSSETYNTPRIYSTFPIVCAYILTFLWTAALAVSVAFTSLMLSGIIEVGNEDKVKFWMPIVAGSSLVEAAIMFYIAIQSHREKKQIHYRNKWRWRIDLTGGSPTAWSISKKNYI